MPEKRPASRDSAPGSDLLLRAGDQRARTSRPHHESPGRVSAVAATFDAWVAVMPEHEWPQLIKGWLPPRGLPIPEARLCFIAGYDSAIADAAKAACNACRRGVAFHATDSGLHVYRSGRQFACRAAGIRALATKEGA